MVAAGFTRLVNIPAHKKLQKKEIQPTPDRSRGGLNDYYQITTHNRRESSRECVDIESPTRRSQLAGRPIEQFQTFICHTTYIRPHHSDHESQYTSINCSAGLATAGIKAPTGAVGNSYDNALAETAGGLYKTELINSRTWHCCNQVERITLNWVYWWNNHHLHESPEHATPIGDYRKL